MRRKKEENFDIESSPIDIMVEENKLLKKINFWEKYKINELYITSFLLFCSWTITAIMGVTLSAINWLPIVTMTDFLTVGIPNCILKKYRMKLGNIEKLEYQFFAEMDTILGNKMDMEDLKIIAYVTDTCLKKSPKIQNISNIAQLLIETGSKRVDIDQAIRNVQGIPMGEDDLDKLYDSIINLNLHDLKILKSWINMYTNDIPEIDKVSNMIQLLVETKLLEYPIEVAEKHLENQEYVKTYKL